MNKVKYFKIDDETIIKFSAEFFEDENGEPSIPGFAISLNEESPNYCFGLEIHTKDEQAALEIVENATQEQAENFFKFISSGDFQKIFEKE